MNIQLNTELYLWELYQTKGDIYSYFYIALIQGQNIGFNTKGLFS